MISVKVNGFTAVIRVTEFGTFSVTIKKNRVEVQKCYFITEHTAKRWARTALTAPTLKLAS